MDVLAKILATAVVLAGCYTPSVRDCTVRCASRDDCASGQICGADGLCAAPEIAGRCRTAPPDAIDRPDATTTGILHVQITGKGSVIVDGSGTCSALPPQRGDCTYAVVLGVAVTARAVDSHPDQTFEMWTSPTCAGQSSRCVFTPVAATTIAATFGKHGMHGDLP